MTEHETVSELERLRTENERMRHELEVMYGGAFDTLKDATDQATLRHLFAQALARHDAVHARYSHGFANRYGVDPETDGFVDAVTAVMGAPADRAAVLDEAADRLDARAAEFTAAARKDPLAFVKGATDARYRTADAWNAAAAELRRMAAEARGAQQDQAARCGCPHPADEHSIYGCADGCGCEWMPKKPPMDPVHILGIDAAPAAPQHVGGNADDCPACQQHGIDMLSYPWECPGNGEQATDEDHVVAYRLGGSQNLRCVECAPSKRGDIWESVTTEDLPDGGVCATCGVDVLIPQQPKEA
jgi:hypothetical protein